MLAFDLAFYPVYFRAYLVLVSIILGLVFGSFGNAWAVRIVHNEKIAKGRSRCPKCNHTLGVRDLVPLFSYLFQKGRCRYCGEPISLRYPLSEGIMALCFATILIRYGLSLASVMLWIFCFFLMVLSFVDWESMIIPDRFLVAASVAGIAYIICQNIYDTNDLLKSVKAVGINIAGGVALAGGLLILVLIMDRILKKDTMGGGDIKLVFVIGLTLGFINGFLSLFIACIIGLIMLFLPGARGRDGEDTSAFPFGPALCIATWIVLLIGDSFIIWYKGLLLW